ncbi:MAG: amidohydrolase [Candidatus Cloacimonetes bacterium]|nr:amidohydrolase [Candidatus Cloacimonadota bacterium]
MVIEFDELQQIRQHLHSFPELADQEERTSEFIKNIINKYITQKVSFINLQKDGFAYVFKSDLPGNTVLLRSELDALPIKENNDFNYASQNENVSHLCGHDGHMTILLGLAKHLSSNPPAKGKIILLFQPSEETGQGAQRIVLNDHFQELFPDYVFALHNLPGYPKNSIIIRKDIFASTSKGLEIKLYGKTSHAAEPEHGNSPVFAVAEIIKRLSETGKNPIVRKYFSKKTLEFTDFSQITVIHTLLGSIAFGTTPGYAEIRATLRSYKQGDMERLTNKTIAIINEINQRYKLKLEFKWLEEFPNTVNDNDSVKIIQKAAHNTNLNVIEPDKPFKWSEDFGHFTNKYRGALFGLGTGLNCPQLHNPNYDFPDDIIEAGIQIYNEIIKLISEE